MAYTSEQVNSIRLANKKKQNKKYQEINKAKISQNKKAYRDENKEKIFEKRGSCRIVGIPT